MAKKSNYTLLADINDFLDETGMGASYFGKVASGSSELVQRLRCGGRCWPETEEKVRAFMAHYRSYEPKHKAVTAFQGVA